VKIGASLQPSFVDQVRTQTNTNRLDVIGISLWANPLLSPYDENGELIPYLQAPSSPYHSAWSFPNPLFVLRESTASQQNFRNLGSAHVEWEIIPGLKAKTALNTIWTTGKANLASVSAGSYLFGGNQVTGSRVGLPNPFLTWEESDQLDAGLDIDLFDSRLALTIDAYHRKSKNMLLEDVVPAITGFTSQLVNSGS